MTTVSKALIQDITTLSEIENQVFMPSDGKLSKRALLYHVKKDNLLLLCKVDEKIVGYILFLCPQNKTYARLYSLAILLEYRGKGLAALLLQEALAKIDKHYQRVFLEVRASNKGAINLYEKFGFKKIKVVLKYYNDGEDALKMSRNI